MAGEAETASEAKAGRWSASTITGLVVALLIVVAIGVFGVPEMWPDRIPVAKNPSWIDDVFADKAVLFGARVVLLSAAITALCGAAYTVASIVAGMRAGNWIKRFGPVEVETAVAVLRTQLSELRLEADAGAAQIRELQQRLQQTQELAEHYYVLWSEAVEPEPEEDSS